MHSKQSGQSSKKPRAVCAGLLGKMLNDFLGYGGVSVPPLLDGFEVL
jgi:hypothetical protein